MTKISTSLFTKLSKYISAFHLSTVSECLMQKMMLAAGQVIFINETANIQN